MTDHTGISVKGLLDRELRHFLPQTTWRETELFENQDIQELKFDSISVQLIVGIRKPNVKKKSELDIGMVYKLLEVGFSLHFI